ncbi:amidohydrolase [Proteiniclasticum sp. QWL-01]|uniref:amidohydrolase n=1 Tax=Proteiniclasticum sp. QWL-01 TaxID=3036945 RepID=UPI00241177D9|nr:amidohydrolase [Proteiniclasticum sp. QWL-01]WFF74434.1 amidohydrolase [Proteiniclasticum sp. QWL-01]
MTKKETAVQYLDNNLGRFTQLSDLIWDNPETRFHLPISAQALIDALTEAGFEIQREIAGMPDAFIATWGTGKPVIGFLGEYDALPNLSQVADLVQKQPQIPGESGHGCGHHVLGAGALAAALAVKEALAGDEAKATIRFFGCPAEEGGSGKAFMARAGVFDGLDAIITWHPMSENRIWGTSSLANFQVYFNFKGTSAHAAAAPHQGRSALDAAELMNIGVNYLREHILPTARVHYAYVDAGGPAPNVVQPTASLLYFIRAPRSLEVKEIYDRVVKIAQGAALMTETQLEIVWDSACSEYIVNDRLGRVMYANMEELGEIDYTQEELDYAKAYWNSLDEASKNNAKGSVRNIYFNSDKAELEEIMASPIARKLAPYKVTDEAIPGSTDVGDASFNAPTVQLTSACYPLGTAPHSWQWVACGKSPMVHKGMLYAAKVMAMTALDLLNDPQARLEAKAEFDERLGDQRYKCYIPDEVQPR